MGKSTDKAIGSYDAILKWGATARKTPEVLTLWQEAMVMCRQSHGDVWNGVRFFLAANGLFFTGMFAALYSSERAVHPSVALLVLASVAFFVNWQARAILRQHRRHYLSMQWRKAVLEEALGLYDLEVAGTDMSFEWAIPRGAFREAVACGREPWIKSRVRPGGTITQRLFLTYEVMAGIDLAVIVAASVWMVRTFGG